MVGETAKDSVRKRGIVRTPGAGGAEASFAIQPRPPAPFCPSAESWLGWVLPCGLRWKPRAPTRTSHASPPLSQACSSLLALPQPPRECFHLPSSRAATTSASPAPGSHGPGVNHLPAEAENEGPHVPKKATLETEHAGSLLLECIISGVDAEFH